MRERVLPFHPMAAGFPGLSTKNRLTHSRDGLTSVLKAELAEIADTSVSEPPR